jgi:hypothetical protein
MPYRDLLLEIAMRCVLLLLLVPSVALAQARPDARRLSCEQARSVVLAYGAVVMSTGTYTYDRYVSGAQFCIRSQVTVPAWISTADNGQCFVGYLCQDRGKQSGR